jgi:hypothetical protein
LCGKKEVITQIWIQIRPKFSTIPHSKIKQSSLCVIFKKNINKKIQLLLVLAGVSRSRKIQLSIISIPD